MFICSIGLFRYYSFTVTGSLTLKAIVFVLLVKIFSPYLDVLMSGEVHYLVTIWCQRCWVWKLFGILFF